MTPFHRILMATDFSDASAPAWRRAVSIARENRAALFVAHTYQPPNRAQAGAVAPAVFEEWDENMRRDVEKKLLLLVNDARKSDVIAQPVVSTGNPEEAIAAAAEENDIDLIVMGTHGRKGVSRFFLGSVAARVISMARCPVLTVRVDEPLVHFRPVPGKETPALQHA